MIVFSGLASKDYSKARFTFVRNLSSIQGRKLYYCKNLFLFAVVLSSLFSHQMSLFF